MMELILLITIVLIFIILIVVGGVKDLMKRNLSNKNKENNINIFLVGCIVDSTSHIIKAFKNKKKAVEFVDKCEKEILRIKQEMKEYHDQYQNELDDILKNIRKLFDEGLKKEAGIYKKDRRLELIMLKQNILKSHKYHNVVYNELYAYEVVTIEFNVD